MIGWVGDRIEDLDLSLYADADFAGCPQTLRSTSGSHMHVSGKHTRFPLAGGSKRQGCVSHSTPEAEIVAADTTLRNHGLPSISMWQAIAGMLPRVVFHDDNQGMIGVVRTGRNPTMRHLDRTHGISIASMHEHFTMDHFVLAYEISSKMSADIHTKGFKSPMMWKRACMLINLLDPEDLSSKELWEIGQPTTDVDTTQRQVFQTQTGSVPNFPYTSTPILPPEVYRPGMSSREGLQHVDTADPIFVAKVPIYYRARPSGLPYSYGGSRSTWVLTNGKWHRTEDHAPPIQQAERFDQYVERACFQYHPYHHQASPVTPVLPTCPAPRGQRPERSVTPQSTTRVSPDYLRWLQPPRARLLFSVEDLLMEIGNNRAQDFYSYRPSTVRVLNTLTRLVHGGSEGRQGFLHDFDKHGIVYDNMAIKEAIQQTSKNKDFWVWDGGEKLIRHHKTPRTKMFKPDDVGDCPVPLHLISDRRECHHYFKSGGKKTEDSWRYKGNDNVVTNKLHQRWTGRTEFHVLESDSVSSNTELDHVSPDDMWRTTAVPGAIALCVSGQSCPFISHDDVCIPRAAMIETKWQHTVSELPSIVIEVVRDDDSKNCRFEFVLSLQDQKRIGHTWRGEVRHIYVQLWEVPQKMPCFVLLCSEETNWFTKQHGHRANNQKREHKRLCEFIVTITADDDLLSSYGQGRAKAAIRSKDDGLMFAGPCTGGSPWNRYNMTVGPETETKIKAKRTLFWKLWEQFVLILEVAISIGAFALCELPRGCDYWEDQRMKTLLSKTSNFVHDFDGCMYGLQARYRRTRDPIKKPWRIVGWYDHIPELCKTCDSSHHHVPCAGRETIVTQLYTTKIVSIILGAFRKRRGLQVTGDIGSRQREIGVCVASTVLEEEQDFLYYLNELDVDRSPIEVGWSPTANRIEVMAIHSEAPDGGAISRKDPSLKILNGILARLNKVDENGRKISSPTRFSETTCPTNEEVFDWIYVYHVTPVIAYSASFVCKMTDDDDVYHALSTLIDLLAYADADDKEMSNGQFLLRGKRLCSVAVRNALANPDDYENLFDEYVRNRLDTVWETLLKYYTPEPIDKDGKVMWLRNLLQKRLAKKGFNATSTLPTGSSEIIITREVNNEWREIFADWTKRHPGVSGMWNPEMLNTALEAFNRHAKHYGFAMREHNAKYPQDKIILDNILKDILDGEHGRGRERSAAYNHFGVTLILGRRMYEYRNYLDEDRRAPEKQKDDEWNQERLLMCRMIDERALSTVVKWFDVREDIWNVGYDIQSAEAGVIQFVKEKAVALDMFQSIVNPADTTIEGEAHLTDAWNIPLEHGDGRNPPELIPGVDALPLWCPTDSWQARTTSGNQVPLADLYEKTVWDEVFDVEENTGVPAGGVASGPHSYQGAKVDPQDKEEKEGLLPTDRDSDWFMFPNPPGVIEVKKEGRKRPSRITDRLQDHVREGDDDTCPIKV